MTLWLVPELCSIECDAAHHDERLYKVRVTVTHRTRDHTATCDDGTCDDASQAGGCRLRGPRLLRGMNCVSEGESPFPWLGTAALRGRREIRVSCV